MWDILRSLFTLNSVRVISTLVVCAAGVWLFVNVEIQNDDETLPARSSAPVISHVTAIADLPAITKSGQFPVVWSGIEGVNATPSEERVSSSEQPVLKLVAVANEGGHYLSIRIDSLQKGAVYAVGAWLKPETQKLVFLQVHDRKPTNYGLLFCDLSARRIFNVQRDVTGQEIKPAENGWLKLVLAVGNADGFLDMTLGFVSAANTTVFKGDGQSALIFGGVEAVPQN